MVAGLFSQKEIRKAGPPDNFPSIWMRFVKKSDAFRRGRLIRDAGVFTTPYGPVQIAPGRCRRNATAARTPSNSHSLEAPEVLLGGPRTPFAPSLRRLKQLEAIARASMKSDLQVGSFDGRLPERGGALANVEINLDGLKGCNYVAATRGKVAGAARKLARGAPEPRAAEI